MTRGLVAGVIILAAIPATAHRLDEYLQGTLLSVDGNRLDARMTLTPGVAVFPILLPYLDADRDGTISPPERSAYAARVLGDLSLAVDGHRLTPELRGVRFPSLADLREGRGGIEIDFSAALPGAGRERRFTIDNHHLTAISAWQVNALAPGDPHVRISAQNRNYSQSHYELVYARTDAPAINLFSRLRSAGERSWFAALALLLLTRLAVVHLARKRQGHPVSLR